MVQNLADPGSGKVNAYATAYIFFVLPHGLLAMSIAWQPTAGASTGATTAPNPTMPNTTTPDPSVGSGDVTGEPGTTTVNVTTGPDDTTGPLVVSILTPLYEAYEAVKRARDDREPLELDLPERKILLKADGTVDRVIVPERLDAHKLIEEFMILANVAAAEMLEKQGLPLIYRVHDQPSQEKVHNLQEFLKTLDLSFAKAGALPSDSLVKPGEWFGSDWRNKTTSAVVPPTVNELDATKVNESKAIEVAGFVRHQAVVLFDRLRDELRDL